MNRQIFASILLILLFIEQAGCTSAPAQAGEATSISALAASQVPVAASPSGLTASQVPVVLFTPIPQAPTSAIIPQASPTAQVQPTPDSTPTEIPCERKGGRIEKGQLDSKLLPDALDYRVYLPPCYDRDTASRYPSLYLIHGQSFTDDQWERLGAGKAADKLIAAGEAPPFIIVMPRDRTWSQPEEDHFGDAVMQELIPYIDSHFRTLTDRRYRAVGGLSRGGGWAVHLGLSEWQYFGAVGAHSLAIFWEDTYYIKKWLDAIPPDQMPRFYIDISNNDYQDVRNSAEWLENQLTQRDIAHEWHVFIGFHNEDYWGGHTEQYIRWYVEDWKK